MVSDIYLPKLIAVGLDPSHCILSFSVHGLLDLLIETFGETVTKIVDL